MRVYCLWALVLAFVMVRFGYAVDPDPVKEKLDQAKAAYQANLDKLDNGILDALKKREDDARKGGQAKLLDAIKSEREAFESKRVVPKWKNPDVYVRVTKQLRADLILAYDTAIKAYTKDATKDKEREVLSREREELATEQAEAVTGDFRKGTIWTGTYQLEGAAKIPVSCEITTMTGMEFAATLTSNDGAMTWKLKGRIAGGLVEWIVTEVSKGRNADDIVKGKAAGVLRGKSMECVLVIPSRSRPLKAAVFLNLDEGK